MNALEFLQAVYPPTGNYCVASPFTPEGSTATIYGHKVFTDLQQMVRYADRMKGDRDVFFSVLTLKAPSVWNARKKNRKTGEMGATEIRTHANMAESRCFFLDLDVGKSTPKVKKFATQDAAAVALKAFCRELGLPRPMVVSSGGGLHVYWLLTDALPADEWEGYANLLHRLVKAKDFHADPHRISDISSVLRIPGTFNHKDGKQRPVEVLVEGRRTDTVAFVKLLKTACKDLQLSEVAKPKSPMASGDGNLGGDYSGKVPSLDNLLEGCALMRSIYEHGGDHPYAVWHKSLAVLRCVDDGVAVCHEWSSRDYPGYDADEVDAKLSDQELQQIGPTSCEVMQGVYGSDHCEGCPVAGKVKGPASAALWPKAAPPRKEEPPKVQLVKEVAVAPRAVLDVPHGYIRTVDGKIVVELTNAEGRKTPVPILDYDLYPLVQQVDGDCSSDQHLWEAKLPRGGRKQFVLPSWVIGDARELQRELSGQSIYVDPERIKHVQKYMSAYVRSLQREADAEQQYTHLGWHSGYTEFAIGDKVLMQGGKAREVSFGGNALPVVQSYGLGRAGTLKKQVELMRFFNRPHMIPHQFFVLGGLASPLLHMTGLHGLIVALRGDQGAGKSTSLLAAMSFWGNPELAMLNGVDKQGITPKARDEYVHTLRNLPVGVDEISNMPEETATGLAYSISQPGGRTGLTQTQKIRVKGVDKSTSKSTIMLVTTNKSLHTLLAADQSSGSASSMRVVEIAVPQFKVKGMADTFLREIKTNYGWIGEAFIRYVLDNYKEVEELIHQMVIKIDKAAGLTPGERFWSSDLACHLVACIICNRLGLLDFDWKVIRDWAIKSLVPAMRGVVEEEYVTPLSFLTGLIEDVMPECVWVSGRNGNLYNDRVPQHGISGRVEKSNQLMWVTLDRVKLQAQRKKVPYKQFVQQLIDMKLILEKNARKTLAAGTEYEGARAYTYMIDMSHEALVGKDDDANKKVPRAADSHLKLVK